MKRIVKFIVMLAVILTVAAFSGTAACAAYSNAQAESLKEMGLFLGTENGFELDRTSTRAEAAVMLVRMLGREAEVKACSYDDPFTDVPAWAENYVGFMYENGLTNGTSATTFGSGDACSAQMFTAFLLRALGYSEENGDFTYAQAQEFAAGIGLSEANGTSDTFLRDDMAALSYSALFQNVNDGSGNILLEELVSEDAVNADAACECLGMYHTYQTISADTSNIQANTNISLKTNMLMSVTTEDAAMDISQTADTSLVLNGGDFIMQQSAVSEMLGATTSSSMYYADGWMYIDSAGTKYKYQYPTDLDSAFAQAGMNRTCEPFYLIDSIEKTETADGTSYKIVYSPAAVNDLFGSELSQSGLFSDALNMQCNALEETLYFTTSGSLKSIAMSGSLSVTYTGDDGPETADLSLQMTSEIIATGSAVTIVPPTDLDEYTELDMSGLL